jgi:hypothetical protein
MRIHAEGSRNMKEGTIIGGQAPSATITAGAAEKIVQEYGACLRSLSIPGRFVMDAGSLPHPKELIKQALILALRLETDPKQREALKSGYIMLSDWQEGVGDEPVGLDVTKMDLNADPIELAKRIHDPLDRLNKWQAVAKEEREALKSELQELGLWEVTSAGR